VFLMNGSAMVMPPRSQGGWQCVAWAEARGERCRQMASAHRSGDNGEWVVPGLGWLSGRSLDGLCLVPGDEVVVAKMIRRVLMQVCEGHESSEESKRDPVAWRPFDLSRDRNLIRLFVPGGGGFDLLPGFEEMEVQVRAFAEALVSSMTK
jgi:hypothetical protein